MSNDYTLYTGGNMNEENTPTPAPVISTPANGRAKKSAVKSLLKEILIFAVIAFGIVLPFRIYIAEPYIVDGASMDPTFHTGDYLIVDKLSYELGAPKRNTVIVFKYPNDPSKNFIKRVIGLPGETVVIKDTVVKIVNAEHPEGLVVDQSYVAHLGLPINLEYKLSGDEYFVMGDNRAESFDSRSWGPLNKKFILGEPVLQLWPLNQISILPGNDTK